jgi:hypothetical protein
MRKCDFCGLYFDESFLFENPYTKERICRACFEGVSPDGNLLIRNKEQNKTGGTCNN